MEGDGTGPLIMIVAGSMWIEAGSPVPSTAFTPVSGNDTGDMSVSTGTTYIETGAAVTLTGTVVILTGTDVTMMVKPVVVINRDRPEGTSNRVKPAVVFSRDKREDTSSRVKPVVVINRDKREGTSNRVKPVAVINRVKPEGTSNRGSNDRQQLQGWQYTATQMRMATSALQKTDIYVPVNVGFFIRRPFRMLWSESIGRWS